MTQSEYDRLSLLVAGATGPAQDDDRAPLTLCERAGVGAVWALSAAVAVVTLLALLSWP